MQQLPEAAMHEMVHNSHATCKLVTDWVRRVMHSTVTLYKRIWLHIASSRATANLHALL